MRCVRHSRNDLGRSRVIGIIKPANFRQIERAGVWPESPGIIIKNYHKCSNKGHGAYYNTLGEGRALI